MRGSNDGRGSGSKWGRASRRSREGTGPAGHLSAGQGLMCAAMMGLGDVVIAEGHAVQCVTWLGLLGCSRVSHQLRAPSSANGVLCPAPVR